MLFADGPFLAGSGLHMPRTGDYLGHALRDWRLEVSGRDFWLRSGDLFTENWVFVDMVRLLGQMGYGIPAPFNAR